MDQVSKSLGKSGEIYYKIFIIFICKNLTQMRIFESYIID